MQLVVAVMQGTEVAVRVVIVQSRHQEILLAIVMLCVAYVVIAAVML